MLIKMSCLPAELPSFGAAFLIFHFNGLWLANLTSNFDNGWLFSWCMRCFSDEIDKFYTYNHTFASRCTDKRYSLLLYSAVHDTFFTNQNYILFELNFVFVKKELQTARWERESLNMRRKNANSIIIHRFLKTRFDFFIHRLIL